MSVNGLRFTPQSPLVQRALELVGQAPMGTEALAREVFGLRQAPAGLASRLLFDLLGEDRRFAVDSNRSVTDGDWSFADHRVVPCWSWSPANHPPRSASTTEEVV